MKIPDRFKLMGRTIEIEYDKNLFAGKDCHGLASYREGKIKLDTGNERQARDGMEQNFCHELAHWILYYAGGDYKPNEKHLHNDEHLVELIGGLIHQFMETKEYEGGG